MVVPLVGRLTVALVPVKGPDVGQVVAAGSGADPEIVGCLRPSGIPGEGG